MIIELNYQPVLEDCTKCGFLDLGAVIKILENTGNKHSDCAGDNILEGSSSGKAWVLTDWRLDVLSYPKYGDMITARTWVETNTSVFGCTRDFEMYADGSLCVKGTTKWVLLDLTAGRPSKVEQALIEKYQPEDKTIYEETKLPKIEIPEHFDRELKIPLRRNDIDFNNHVHNLTYLTFAFESLPEEVYDERNFSRLRITYKTAVKSGEEIICRYAKIEDRHIVCIYGTDGKIRTLIEMA